MITNTNRVTNTVTKTDTNTKTDTKTKTNTMGFSRNWDMPYCRAPGLTFRSTCRLCSVTKKPDNCNNMNCKTFSFSKGRKVMEMPYQVSR